MVYKTQRSVFRDLFGSPCIFEFLLQIFACYTFKIRIWGNSDFLDGGIPFVLCGSTDYEKDTAFEKLYSLTRGRVL